MISLPQDWSNTNNIITLKLLQIRLEPSILHDTEALDRLSGFDELKVEITKEYEKYTGDIPSVYTSYLLQPLALILEKIAYIRRWFLVIRSGRESCTIEYGIDIFTIDATLRYRVGLRSL